MQCLPLIARYIHHDIFYTITSKVLHTKQLITIGLLKSLIIRRALQQLNKFQTYSIVTERTLITRRLYNSN